eukprot:TRINITY_DN8617_c0_g1_i1.p1 TRINITY_DN8617_c0_g1~~TRINITY_DN8617_c0_g1_i1.p1  ORF type:complete len:764 (-),score=155.95 TRINITY_DN8617_c0_g1_i1:185-2476(-)
MAQMEKLLPVINKLQDVFNTIGQDPLDLPQIVVVGSQSAGKSSVLESIVGRDFLPRGSGIVTRRPLVLQLIYLPVPESKGKAAGLSREPGVEWGEFLHKPSEMFYDFDKIREEIERETDRMTGSNKGISSVPINLKIYSPHVLNLTLVDLPGITKVPVGDQPPDIEVQIRRMVRTYIERPNAIILAITAGNTDIANSDALQLAREVDPEGERTVGVITKIDIMDKGTDALELLAGRVIPLKLGFVGVVNRSQHDIMTKKSIRDALRNEQEYFSSHQIYRTIASRCGTGFLAKQLNKILIHHIRDCLPELKVKVSRMMAETQTELMAYGDPLYDTKSSQGALLLQIITRFSANYRDAIDGKLTDLSVNELYGGARVNYIFNEIFARCLDRINPVEGLTGDDIRTAIRNATGPKAALFIPEESFELLVKQQITRLEEPSLACVELVYEELQRIVAQLETKELMRFANLRERVVDVVGNLLNKYRTPSREMIQHLVAIELAFVNTNHPDFIGGDGAITKILERMSQAQMDKDKAGQQAGQVPKNPQNPQVPPRAGGPQQPASQHAQMAAPPPVPPQPQQSQQPPAGDYGQQAGFFNMFFGGRAGPQKPNQPDSFGAAPDPRQQQSAPRQQPGSRPGPYGMQSSQMSGRADKLDQVPVSIKPATMPSDKENFETELIKTLLLSYYGIVRKNMKDSVPKSIMHFLVNRSKETIQNELVASLYKEELFEELLEESSQIAKRRNACKTMLDVLRRANEILTEVRDFQVPT